MPACRRSGTAPPPSSSLCGTAPPTSGSTGARAELYGRRVPCTGLASKPVAGPLVPPRLALVRLLVMPLLAWLRPLRVPPACGPCPRPLPSAPPHAFCHHPPPCPKAHCQRGGEAARGPTGWLGRMMPAQMVQLPPPWASLHSDFPGRAPLRLRRDGSASSTQHQQQGSHSCSA